MPNAENGKEIIKDTVHEVLFQLGLATDDNDAVSEVRKDFMWLRSARKTSETVGMNSVLTAVAIAIGGALTAFWIGVQSLFHGGANHG